jgi:hypothetical protein
VADLEGRLDYLLDRLRSAYDAIGHSSGRPYVYFVYPPDQERAMRRLADERLREVHGLCFHHLDLLPLTISALDRQEERREQLLADPARGSGTAEAILRLWARAVTRSIHESLQHTDVQSADIRPVIVLRGLAALHPLGNPTSLMEAIADQETCDPATGRMAPVVLLVPGIRPPQTSRTYLFLGQENLRLQFYRGEEV